MHEQVVRRQVAVRETLVGQEPEHIQQLVPQLGQVLGLRPQLGQPGGGRTVRLVEVLQQHLGAQQLHRVGHRRPELGQPGECGELRRRPLPGQQMATELGAVRHGPRLTGAPHPAPVGVAGVAVEQPVLGAAVPLGGQQGARPAGHRPLQEADVSLLAGLEHAEVGVRGGSVGDHPARPRGGSVLRVGPAAGAGSSRVGCVVGVPPDRPAAARLAPPGLVGVESGPPGARGRAGEIVGEHREPLGDPGRPALTWGATRGGGVRGRRARAAAS